MRQQEAQPAARTLPVLRPEPWFMGCSKLTSIVIPDGVTRIRSEMFSGCAALASIDFPNCVTSIDYGAFDGCAVLTGESEAAPAGLLRSAQQPERKWHRYYIICWGNRVKNQVNIK